MKHRTLIGSQRGFSLITALFILLVLAVLGGVMATMSGVQSRSFLWAYEGAQAYHAARSGLEWGVAKGLADDACAAGSFAVGDFTVTVTCVQQSFQEAAQTYNVYQLTSLAERGSYGDDDYVSRSLRARVTGAVQ